MGSKSDVEIVRDLYRAFAKMDLDAIIAAVHEDVVAEQTSGLPWGGRYEGKDGLVVGFEAHIDTPAMLDALAAGS